MVTVERGGAVLVGCIANSVPAKGVLPLEQCVCESITLFCFEGIGIYCCRRNGAVTLVCCEKEGMGWADNTFTSCLTVDARATAHALVSL